jgi:hypothetical protein
LSAFSERLVGLFLGTGYIAEEKKKYQEEKEEKISVTEKVSAC